MPYGPQKLILIHTGRYDYAEVALSGSLQLVGPNNTGKTTLINTLQFLYIDNWQHLDFAPHTSEQTRNYYFPDQYSYILFENLGARGTFVLGWRGLSKVAGGDPERFHYEGPFDSADFLDEQGQVREPTAVRARLSLKHYTVLASAQEHRGLLLLPTKGEPNGAGLVALRDNDQYPQFRETLKNLLSLSTISQDQMRDRLLMLAGIPTAKVALDVRRLFGEDYDRVLRLKDRFMCFKKHQSEIELLVKRHARRETVRAEQKYRWTDMRTKRMDFESAHSATLESLRVSGVNATAEAEKLSETMKQTRAAADSLLEKRGELRTQLDQLAAQARRFKEFEEELVRASLKNVEKEVSRLERLLDDAANETRERAEAKIEVYRESVAQKRETIAHFERALVTVLRRDLSDEELAPLARLFNFDLLHGRVGDDGIQLRGHDDFVRLLRTLVRRIQNGVYRDANVELPLPASHQSLAQLANPDAVRDRLTEEEAMLERWERILSSIAERETITNDLDQKRGAADKLRKSLFGWAQFQDAKVGEPRLKGELQATDDALDAADKCITKLGKRIEGFRAAKTAADRAMEVEDKSFEAVMERFQKCTFPEYSVNATAPTETIPENFDSTVALFLSHQRELAELDDLVREAFHVIESVFGSDFAGADSAESVRVLREELEALPEREEALRRDWNHLLVALRATFDEVLRALDDITSARDQLNRALSGIQVSSLKVLRMDVVEHADLVGAVRKLTKVEQPGLFDDNAALEATLGAFRRRFEANPLLRYADLFVLQFTVTGEDGEVHHYHDFKQVESHGTTITIKVLFSLLVLRSLLREDRSKALVCEVPFFLDEIHSLDAANRHAILATARKLGFIAITAAPESVSEVQALYVLQPKRGRIVLRHRHRVGIRRQASSA